MKVYQYMHLLLFVIQILFFVGLGHYEINMVKALFKLLWQVGIQDLGKMLGFRSPKALATCESASGMYII